MERGSVRTRSGDIYKPSVVRGYATSLRLRLLPALGARKLGDISRRDVQRLVDGWLEEGMDASTIRNSLMPLRVIYRRADTGWPDRAVTLRAAAAAPRRGTA